MKKFFLFISFCTLGVSGFAQTNLTNGLIAYYPFNNNANDASGNGQHGVVSGNAIYSTDRFSNANKAFSFDGSTSIQAALGSALQNLGTSDFTFAFWISNTNSGNIFIPYLSASEPMQDQIYFYHSYSPINSTYNPMNVLCRDAQQQPYAYTTNMQTQNLGDPNPLGDGAWHLIVFTRDSISLSLYVDGSSQVYNGSTTAGVSDFALDTLLLGYASPSYYGGAMDDIMIYNRALTTGQIDSLYSLTASLPGVTTGINTTASNFDFNIYPNPVANDFQISFPAADEYRVVVTNIAGVQLLNQEVQNESTLQVNTNNWASGIYLVQVRDKKGIAVSKKVVKQ